MRKTFSAALYAQNPQFQMYDEVEAVAGRLRHPSPTSTDDSDDVCENFLYVFEPSTPRPACRVDVLARKAYK